ncbi:MAG TPA: phosphate signaling complex protein PhoU [Proteobacteria bacterium]|nr:phosphate signaling complex protein PhoU [Pseudomonadota bacterium]
MHRLQREIDELKRRLSELMGMVEERVWMAVKALEERDAELASSVIESDDEIDEFETRLEEECLKVLALYQPVAIDLRYIVTILKVNAELERVGDLAVNVAERAEFLARHKEIETPRLLKDMANKALAMLKDSLDALTRMDAKLARSVCGADDEVDELNREMFRLTEDLIENDPGDVKPLIHLLSVSRHLERIADHATNIAEDVVYLIEGEIVRHRPERF